MSERTGFWPGPTRHAGAVVPLAVLTGALGFAVFVPIFRVGIGWLLAGTVAGVAVTFVARRVGAEVSRKVRLLRAGWGLAALALLSVLAFRNAWWLVTFCVMGALGAATLAVVGPRSIRAMVFACVAVPVAAFRGLPWVVRQLRDRPAAAAPAEVPSAEVANLPSAAGAVAVAAPPARDGTGLTLVRAAISVLVTAVLLLIFGALFASADVAFAKFLDDLVPDLDAGRVFRWVFAFVAGAAATIAALFLVAAPVNLTVLETTGSGRLRRGDWALPIGALVVLFGGFVAVQVTVLFGGRTHVLETTGLTYAEYARSGFWQLVAVTLLSMLVVAVTGRWARRDQPGARLLLRLLLGLLCALSLVIVASAYYRMQTYQQAYGYTGERIFVVAVEVLLGVVFLMIMLAGIRLRGGWLPQAAAAATVVMLLSLAVLNPEGFAASRNVARYHSQGKIDLHYLRALSADATPALAGLDPQPRGCALNLISARLREPDPWYAWNLGREQARDVLARLGPGAIGDCSKARSYNSPSR